MKEVGEVGGEGAVAGVDRTSVPVIFPGPTTLMDDALFSGCRLSRTCRCSGSGWFFTVLFDTLSRVMSPFRPCFIIISPSLHIRSIFNCHLNTFHPCQNTVRPFHFFFFFFFFSFL